MKIVIQLFLSIVVLLSAVNAFAQPIPINSQLGNSAYPSDEIITIADGNGGFVDGWHSELLVGNNANTTDFWYGINNPIKLIFQQPITDTVEIVQGSLLLRDGTTKAQGFEYSFNGIDWFVAGGVDAYKVSENWYNPVSNAPIGAYYQLWSTPIQVTSPTTEIFIRPLTDGPIDQIHFVGAVNVSNDTENDIYGPIITSLKITNPINSNGGFFYPKLTVCDANNIKFIRLNAKIGTNRFVNVAKKWFPVQTRSVCTSTGTDFIHQYWPDNSAGTRVVYMLVAVDENGNKTRVRVITRVRKNGSLNVVRIDQL